MCGFFFVVQRGKPIDVDRFADALSLSRHRGPDSSRTSVYSVEDPNGFEPTVHVGAGFNRLSIIDLDHRSDQPFEREGCTLVFNGEIYNYKALRRELADRGATFTTSGDTEVLFNTISFAKLTSLDALNGMWAFCFHDRNEGVLYEARARFGKKPIFDHHGPDAFCCRSNIAAILHYLKRTFAFRGPSLLPYLAGGGSGGGFWPSRDFTTHVEAVEQIPAGHILTFDLRNWSLSHVRYFDVTALPIQAVEDMQELADTFLDSVKLRLVSDRTVGLLISGGVDSSLILVVLRTSVLIVRLRGFFG